MAENPAEQSARKKGSLLKEVPTWGWFAIGAAILVIIVLRLRSSSSTPANPTLVAPVSPPTDVATSGTGSGSSPVSTIVSQPPDYTSELASVAASLAAMTALLQQELLQQPFRNTIHPVPVTVPPSQIPRGTGDPSQNPPSYPGGTGNYTNPDGTTNPGYVGPLPGSPAFGRGPGYWQGSFIAPSSIHAVVVGHPMAVTNPGYPSTALHAGIGARPPRLAVNPPGPPITR